MKLAYCRGACLLFLLSFGAIFCGCGHKEDADEAKSAAPAAATGGVESAGNAGGGQGAKVQRMPGNLKSQ